MLGSFSHRVLCALLNSVTNSTFPSRIGPLCFLLLKLPQVLSLLHFFPIKYFPDSVINLAFRRQLWAHQLLTQSLELTSYCCKIKWKLLSLTLCHSVLLLCVFHPYTFSNWRGPSFALLMFLSPSLFCPLLLCLQGNLLLLHPCVPKSAHSSGPTHSGPLPSRWSLFSSPVSPPLNF